MKLRRFLLVSTALSSAVLMASVEASFAQDFDWSGFYAGAGVGVVGGSDGGSLNFNDPGTNITDLLNAGPLVNPELSPIFDDGELTDFPGAIKGVGLELNAGYNVEVDNFLFGIEASVLTGPFKSTAEYVESGTVSYETSSLVTVRDTFTTSSSTLTTTSTSYQVTSYESYSTYTQHVTSTVGPSSTLVYDTQTTITTITTTLTTSATSTITTFTSSYSTMTTETTGSVPLSTLTTLSYPTSTISGITTSTYTPVGQWATEVTGRAQIDWLATIKGRVGLTADRTLFFATGGLAIGGVSQETTGTLTINAGSQTVSTWHGTKNETKYGVVVGGGVEQAVDDHWVLSGEAEYFNLGTVEYDVTSDDAGVTGVVGKAKQTLDGGSVKLGIKYKF